MRLCTKFVALKSNSKICRDHLMKQVGLSRAILESQVKFFLLVTGLRKHGYNGPVINLITHQTLYKNWSLSWLDLSCPELTGPDFACPDLSCPDLTCPDLKFPGLTYSKIICLDLSWMNRNIFLDVQFLDQKTFNKPSVGLIFWDQNNFWSKCI